jgi:hypothetical protein
MPTWTEKELLNLLDFDAQSDGLDIQKDNDGQLIIYTGFRENELGNLERIDRDA